MEACRFYIKFLPRHGFHDLLTLAGIFKEVIVLGNVYTAFSNSTTILKVRKVTILLLKQVGSSMVVQWLGFCLLMQQVQVQFLVRKLRSHMPPGQKTKI